MHALLHQVWRKSAVFTVGLLAAGLIVAGCGGSSGTAGTTPTATATTALTATTAPTATTNPNQASIRIDGSAASGYKFDPATITIKVGAAVVWSNTTSVPHTSTSDTGSAVMWSSPTIDPGSTFSFTFTQAGTFKYHCNFHPYMHGTIVVTS
jgi:plastocyanin